MTLKVYIDFMSQPSRAVVALLYHNNVPFELHETRIAVGDHRKPEFLKINPAGQVPAIVDDDVVIAESHAILRYICNSKNVAEHWYPQDPKIRAKCDYYLDFHHSFTRRAARLFRAGFRELFPKDKFTDEDIQAEQKALKRTLTFIENIFLKENKFLILPDKPTIADISAVCELIQLYTIKFDFTQYPKIDAWMKRVLELEGMQKAHKVFYKVGEKLKERAKL